MRHAHLLAVALSLVPLSAALAAEFTFTVPIELKTVSATVKGYGARCTATNLPTSNPAWKAIGAATVGPIALGAGQTSIKGNVTVAFDHNPAYGAASDAKAYECAILLCSSATDSASCRQATTPGAPGASQAPSWTLTQPGGTVSVVGSLP